MVLKNQAAVKSEPVATELSQKAVHCNSDSTRHRYTNLKDSLEVEGKAVPERELAAGGARDEPAALGSPRQNVTTFTS